MNAFTSLFAIIVDTTFKATLLLSLAWIVGYALRNRSAASRHLIRTFGLCGALMLPLLSSLLPQWQVRIIPQFRANAKPPVAAPAVRPTAAILPDIPSKAPARIAARVKISHQPAAPSAVPVQPQKSSLPPVTLISTSLPKLTLSWPQVIAIVWVLGALLFLIRMLIARLRLRRLVSKAVLVQDHAWTSQLRAAAGLLRIRKPVALLQSAETEVPLATGTLCPKIILPAEHVEWATPRCRAVLHHELAHIKRLDPFTQALTEFAVALYWFHPLVWLAALAARAERERACDDYVLALGAKPSEYAHELLEIASTLRQPALRAALAMARRSQLEGRLMALLNPALRRGSVSQKVTLLIACLTLCLVLPLAVLHAGQEAKPSPATRDQASVPTTTPGSTQHTSAQQPSAQPSTHDQDLVEPPELPPPPDSGEMEAPDAYREKLQELLERAAELRDRAELHNQEQSREQEQRARELLDRMAELQAKNQAFLSQAQSSELSHLNAEQYARLAELQAGIAELQTRLGTAESLVAPGALLMPGIQGGVPGGIPGGIPDGILGGQEGGVPAVPAVPAVPGVPGVPAVPAVPAVPGGELDVCGTHVKLHNMSINSDNGRRRWNGYWSGDDCSVELRAEGDIDFNADATEILSISSGGFFEVHLRQGDNSKDVKVAPSSNGLQYVYKVNGKEQPFDAQAKAWFSSFLQELERSTGIAADSRVRKLLEKGGPTAVLNEINHLHGDYVRGLYFRKLLDQPNLPSATVVRVINQAGEQIRSDYEKAQVLMEVARQYPLSDEASRTAFLNASGKLNSDYEHSRVLIELLKRPDISAQDVEVALHSAASIRSDYEKSRILLSLAGQSAFQQSYLDAYLKTVASIQSDYEKSRDLLAPMQKFSLDAKQINRILETAATINSDYEKSRLLTGLVTKGKFDESQIDQYLKVVNSINSDYERSRSLTALLAQNTLSKEALGRVLDATGSIHSDYEKAGILVMVAQKYPLEGALRDKYISIANTLSQYERSRALAGVVHRASI